MATKAEINLVKSLSGRGERLESGLFVAEGHKLVGEIASSGMRLRKAFYSGEEDLIIKGVVCERTPGKDMERLSRLKTPSSVVALVELPRYAPDLSALKDKLLLALDGVQDPGNLGTIIRLADWFGISDILCSENSADCFNPKVVQATMGAITRVRVHYGDLAAWLPVIGSPVYGTFLEGDNIYGASLAPAGIVVMGSEGRGVSPEIEALVTQKLHIPPYPADATASESLNVATATAIVCSEFRRRR